MDKVPNIQVSKLILLNLLCNNYLFQIHGKDKIRQVGAHTKLSNLLSTVIRCRNRRVSDFVLCQKIENQHFIEVPNPVFLRFRFFRRKLLELWVALPPSTRLREPGGGAKSYLQKTTFAKPPSNGRTSSAR